MTDDPGNEIRERFRATALPAAPVRLRERLAAISSSTAATTSSRFGRARLVVALAAAVAVASIGLLVGGGADEPSPSPNGGPWGPLAVANLMAAEDALTHGELLFTDHCAFLVEGDGTRVLLVWPAARTTWDAQTRTVRLKHLQTNEVLALREGVPFDLGGGGSSVSEDGLSGEAWATRFDWVAPPDPECLTDERWVVSDAAPETVLAPTDPAAPTIVCAEQYDGPGLRLTCEQAVDAVLAALGEDQPPISRMEFSYGCRDVGGIAGDCAEQLSGHVAVYSMGNERFQPRTEGYGQTFVLFVQGDGRIATADLLFSQSFEVSCREDEPPALACAEAVDAALRNGDFGPNPGAVANVTIARFCDTTCQPAFKSVLVDITFSSEVATIELTVYTTPEGPTVQQLDSFLPRFRPPYGDAPSLERTTAIEAVALRRVRTDVLSDLDVLTIEFYGNTCLGPYEPWVGVTEGRVQVAIVATRQGIPRQTGPACATVLYVYALELPEPFDGSLVEDLGTGRTFEVEMRPTRPVPT